MDREISLGGVDAVRLADLASAWGDLLYVRQVLHSRSEIPVAPVHLFARRALWEAAVVAYGRCWNSGRRAKLPPELLADLSPEQRALHSHVLGVRNKHVAHRVEQAFERTDVSAVFRNSTNVVRGVRIRVSTSIGPEGSDVADEFESLVDEMKNRLWKTRMAPLERALVASLASQAPRLSSRARSRPKLSTGAPDEMVITINRSGA